MVYNFDPDYAVVPGESLREILDVLHMSQKEFADRTELTVQSVSRILTGEQPITHDTALKLELVTPYSAKFWLNLELNYRTQIIKLEEKQKRKAELEWLLTIPTKVLSERGYIQRSPDKGEVLLQTLKFYGVSSPTAWEAVWENPKAAARKSKCFTAHPGATSAWIRMGEVEGQKIETEPYSKAKFKEAIGYIRDHTASAPTQFISMIQEKCSEAGVVVSFIPEIKHVPLNGTTKWISSDRALIVVNIRGKREDMFWFSFFHEAGHVLLHKKKELYIHDDSQDNNEEVEADNFASEFLIPKEYNQAIIHSSNQSDILAISAELKISSSIVAGRYQFLTKRWDRYSRLIRKLEWTED